MTIQEILVIVVAAAAGLYLARTAWRTWSGSGCEKGCGCGPKRQEPAKLIAAEDLLVRVRSGKRSEGRK
jgi:hypothetical protein